jgi:hypothetical protein
MTKNSGRDFSPLLTEPSIPRPMIAEGISGLGVLSSASWALWR